MKRLFFIMVFYSLNCISVASQNVLLSLLWLCQFVFWIIIIISVVIINNKNNNRKNMWKVRAPLWPKAVIFMTAVSIFFLNDSWDSVVYLLPFMLLRERLCCKLSCTNHQGHPLTKGSLLEDITPAFPPTHPCFISIDEHIDFCVFPGQRQNENVLASRGEDWCVCYLRGLLIVQQQKWRGQQRLQWPSHYFICSRISPYWRFGRGGKEDSGV